MLERLTCIGSVGYLGGLMTLPEAFCWSWGQFREFNTQFVCGPTEVIHYTRATFSLHSQARNYLVESMQGEWLLQLDTDVIVEPDALLKMLTIMQRYNTPVLSGIYRHKALPHHAMLWCWDNEENGFTPLAEYSNPHIPCFKVDATGGGCLLVHRSVFTKMKESYPDEGPFDHRGKFGEDFSFFVRCRELAIPVYATPQVETIHLMARGVDESLYVPDWFQTEEIAVGVPGLVERA